MSYPGHPLDLLARYDRPATPNGASVSFRNSGPSGSTGASPPRQRPPQPPPTPLEQQAMQPPYNMGRQDLNDIYAQTVLSHLLGIGVGMAAGEGAGKVIGSLWNAAKGLAEGSFTARDIHELFDLPASVKDDCEKAIQKRMDDIDTAIQERRDEKNSTVIGADGVYFDVWPGPSD